MSRKRVIYYIDAKGRSPVLEAIKAFTLKDQQKIFAYVSLLEERGEELRRPIADYVGEKLYELRPKAHRALYFFLIRDHAVVVHAFRKRSNRLPDAEKRIALSRMDDFLKRYWQGKINLGD